MLANPPERRVIPDLDAALTALRAAIEEGGRHPMLFEQYEEYEHGGERHSMAGRRVWLSGRRAEDVF